jgi:tryptophan synthase alpha chain
MSRIPEAFDHGKAFIAFITCGDPDLETTGKVVRAAVKTAPTSLNSAFPFPTPRPRALLFKAPICTRCRTA